MAKIVPSDLAPAEPFKIVVAYGSFDLDGSKKTSSYETDDYALIASAREHPWVTVEMKAEEAFVPPHHTNLDPKTDPLSGQHPDAALAFDAEAARAAYEKEAAIAPVAIDAGLDQSEVIEAGPVDKTVAAVAETEAEVAEAEKAEKAAVKAAAKEKK